MAADASSTLARGKILLKAQEVTFAKALAGNNLVLRDRAVRRLKKWFDARSKGKFCFEEEDLMRVWKGLYHCMWMSDKPLVQEALSEEISGLIHSFATPSQMMLFVRCFYQTLINEWVGIDQLRLDKFLMLVRRVLRQTLVALRRLQWKSDALELYNTAIGSTLLSPQDLVPIGLATHYCSIFLEELAKIGGPELEGSVVSRLLPPVVALWADSRVIEVRKMVMRCVLDPLIAQSPITQREDARFHAWAQAGFPGKSMYCMELVEEPDQEEEEPHGAESFDGLDPRAGSADVVLQPIAFDAGLVATLFGRHLEGKVGRAHVSVSRQQLKFERLAAGLDPITRRHRVRYLRTLPMMRKHDKWRCARQWQSAVELADFDPEAWKASRKQGTKYQGATDEEIFADFLSKKATGKKRGASGDFTVANADNVLANGEVANKPVANGLPGGKKKRLSAGGWTVTAENGVGDSSAPSQQSPVHTPANTPGKRRKTETPDNQATDQGVVKKQTPAQATPGKSAQKKTPKVESAQKQTPQVESAQKKTPKVESAQKQTPQVQSAQKKMPKLESAQKQTPQVESAQKKTPKVESAQKQTPHVEAAQKKQTPQVESAQKKVQQVESAKKQTPKVESVQKKTPKVESVQKKTPKVESVQKKTPQVESAQNKPLPVESSKKAKRPAESPAEQPESGTPARTPDGGRRKLFSLADNQVLSLPPAPGQEPVSPKPTRKSLPAAKVSVAAGASKVRSSFGALAESLKKSSSPLVKLTQDKPLVKPSDVKPGQDKMDKQAAVKETSQLNKSQEQPSKPAVSPMTISKQSNKEAAEIPKQTESDSTTVSPGHRLSLNVIPAVVPAVTRSKKKTEAPASPCRTSLRIAQKAPRVKTKTPPPPRAAPRAAEVLRAARASLGSPAGSKRVNISLARNEAQEVWEYHAALESSPGIPYDAKRRPTESALKPGAVPSPVNPFYKRPKFLL